MFHAERIAEFATSLNWSEIPERDRQYTRLVLADTLACAIGAIDDEGPSILRRYAVAKSGSGAATLIGTGEQVDVRMAALVNSTLSRDLDANDLYAGPPDRDTGHFSDAIPALLAVAEQHASNGEELLTAIVIAYEIQAALAESYLWMDRGLHSVSQVAWAVPAAAGRLMGLSREQIVSAIGLAGSTGGLVLQSWLRPSRQIPMLKGGSAGFTAAAGIEAAELAAAGFTAPPDALETLFARLPSDAKEDSIERLSRRDKFTTHRNMMKRYPAQIYTQSAIQASVQISPEIDSLDDIAVVTVYGHERLVAGVQGSASAYAPESRATADHSTPFVVAATLRDGDLTPKTYTSNPWNDEDIADLLRRIDLVIDPAMDEALRTEGKLGCTLVVEMMDGRRFASHVEQQQGHPDQPLERSSLLDKMRTFADWKLGPGTSEQLLSVVEGIDQSTTVDQLISTIVRT